MSQKSNEIIREAVLEMNKGNISSAIAKLDSAVACDRDDADAWAILGGLLLGNGDNRAADCFIELKRIEPDKPDGYEQLVYAYSATGRHELALKAALDFTHKFPDNANAWALLAAMHEQTADKHNENCGFDKAIEYYEKALKIDPNHKLAKKCLPALYDDRNAQEVAFILSRIMAAKDDTSRLKELNVLIALGDKSTRPLLRLAFEEKGDHPVFFNTMIMAIWCGCALHTAEFQEYYHAQYRKGESSRLDTMREINMLDGIKGNTIVHRLLEQKNLF